MGRKQLFAAIVISGIVAISPVLAVSAVDETTTPPVIDNPDNVAVDVDGVPYPEGGPEDLYDAIEDKQEKLNNDPEQQGLENALSRLRRNLERVLEGVGIGADTPDTPDTPNDIVDPENPDNVAVDAGGNPYPEGGPAGLYRAIEDKQAKLLLDPDNPGLNNALNKLRNNLEKQLEKRNIPMDSGVVVGGEMERVEKKERVEKTARVEKADRPDKPMKVERMSKPERPVKVERPAKPERPAKVERPAKPERPTKPEKPVKPEKPNRPGR